MPLSLNEIRARAFAFAKEWADEASEDAEAKSFWDGFFNVFGVHRRRVATFEEPVRKASGNGGYIDLLWRGVLLVEHKSRGKDLERAKGQAFDYFSGLKDRDLPRYVIVSDFARIRLYDLEPDEQAHAKLPLFARGWGTDPETDGKRPVEFPLSELPQCIGLFGFLSGYEARSFGNEDPVNVKAAEKLGALHDLLNASGYSGHELEVFLVRVLFCLFADYTGIFERGAFRQLIEQRTGEDGSDLGLWLSKLFDVLNRPKERRAKALDEQLAAFPHVNGKLFEEPVTPPDFDSKMRETLFTCLVLDWSRINPSIFGSMFQSIMDKGKRRNLGAHYTSETNILKALRPLFLDALRAEFEQVRGSTRRLNEFHAKLANIRIMDPACGCGNFLVIAYRELRLLEIDVLRELLKRERNLNLDILSLVRLDVDQFYGIEAEEWPAQIAQVALWLMDHLMNLTVSTEFGHYFARLPLRKAPTITHGNALRVDWRTIIAPQALAYIVGNPPFVGHQWRNAEQMSDMSRTWGATGRFHRLDYVTCWFRKAAEFMDTNPNIRAALVATNSITQGEQVGTLWEDLLRRGARIHFAHRTFQWQNEARGKAAVHCVIIGFGLVEPTTRTIFDYATPKSEPQAIAAKNINPYLVDGPTVLLPSRTAPRSGLPPLRQGSKPWDGGHLLFTEVEKANFVSVEPEARNWLRPYVGGDELIYGYCRWCLWLKGISPAELKRMPYVQERLRLVAEARRRSPTAVVKLLANQPTLFAQDRQPNQPYLAVPEVSSENRRFVPISFMPPEVIGSNKLLIGVGATLYHFGVLNSTMHMAWVRAVAGRLESRLSYAPAVYNNFPWPEPPPKQHETIMAAGQSVLDVRAQYAATTLADLYDITTMPTALVKAHNLLDRAVDLAYGRRSFDSEAERVAFLFEQYQALTAPLAPAPRKPTARRRSTAATGTTPALISK